MLKMAVAACALLAVTPVAVAAQVFAGPEFRINQYTTGPQGFPSVAMTPAGDFKVVWNGAGPAGDSDGVVARRFDARGSAVGGDFPVNTYTTGSQGGLSSDAAVDRAGNLVVVWPGVNPDGSSMEVFGQRFGSTGAPLGGEFQVNTYTTGNQGDRFSVGTVSVARAPDGRFVVVWQSFPSLAAGHDIFGQRYDAAGNPAGGEFRVNTYTTYSQTKPDVATDANGNFVVVWSSWGQDYSGQGVFGQRFSSTGAPLGAEFAVNSTTLGDQGAVDTYSGASVARAPTGEFVVVWDDNSENDVFAQRYDSAGNRAGGEFKANSTPPGGIFEGQSSVAMDDAGNFVVAFVASQNPPLWEAMGRRFAADGTPRGPEFPMDTTVSVAPNLVPTVASDAVGNFLIAWDQILNDPGDTSGSVRAQRFGGFRPVALRVDSAGNGVWESGETVTIRPIWQNTNGASLGFLGGLSQLEGPAGGTYTLTDGAGDYGMVADGASAECVDCYAASVAAPARPALHWDATAIETISPLAQGQQKKWRLHVGGSFTDVPAASGFYRFVETLLHHGITGGCSPTQYCPASATTREQMAAFVLVTKEAPGYAPPACGATPMFADVPVSSPFCRWIEELARRGVVSGCGGGNYCPAASVTRAQMPIFVLRTLDPALNPPACATPVFADVPAGDPFCRWIEELARRGVVTGCGGGNYCPSASVTREQMGVFIGVTFALTLYGP